MTRLPSFLPTDPVEVREWYMLSSEIRFLAYVMARDAARIDETVTIDTDVCACDGVGMCTRHINEMLKEHPMRHD